MLTFENVYTHCPNCNELVDRMHLEKDQYGNKVCEYCLEEEDE